MTTDQKVIGGVALISILILAFAVFFMGGNSQKSGPVDQSLLVKSDSNKIASDSAKVTLVEFGDYQCPACGMAAPVIKQILDEYQGRVSFVFRHFPLPQHSNAMIAAKAAEAAGEQGKYWQMHDRLYSDQQQWENLPDPTETFIGYAKEFGMDENAFKASISTEKFFDKINGDKNDGNTLGVDSTPTFFVNGIKIRGFAYNDLKQQIERALQ
jgi:protein-disulfide isomerase